MKPYRKRKKGDVEEQGGVESINLFLDGAFIVFKDI